MRLGRQCKNREGDDEEELKLTKTPDKVKVQLLNVLLMRPNLPPELRQVLFGAAVNVEELFNQARREEAPAEVESLTAAFLRHLTQLCTVVEMYVRIRANVAAFNTRENPDQAAELLEKQAAGMRGFAAMAQQAVQDANRQQIIEASVAADTLAASEFGSID